jgi:hypothetical protein
MHWKTTAIRISRPMLGYLHKILYRHKSTIQRAYADWTFSANLDGYKITIRNATKKVQET